MSEALNRIRETTRGTEYESKLYLVGGVLMLVHGMISHQQAVQHFNEGTEEE